MQSLSIQVEKARKAEEKARKAEEKAAEKARKAEEKVRKAEKKAAEKEVKAQYKIIIAKQKANALAAKEAEKVRKAEEKAQKAAEKAAKYADIRTEECCICLDNHKITCMYKLKACGHLLGKVCANQWLLVHDADRSALKCPLCRTPIDL